MFTSWATCVALAALVLVPRVARAQSCCAGAGLVIPARLRLHEDYAVGLQTRGRAIVGSFDATGDYHGSSSGNVDGEQDVLAAMRFLDKGQAAVLIPFMATRRSVPGLAEWGAGIGDVALMARYDFTIAGQHPRFPGVAVLLGLLLPTGRAADDARNTLATDATGTGTWEGSIGLGLEQSWRHLFAAFEGWIGQRSPRAAEGVRQSFEPRFTALLLGGYVFDNELSLGLFVTANWQGASHDRSSDQVIQGSETSLVSGGGALVVPITDAWRAQGTAYLNAPFTNFGRNELSGVGASLSVLRVWM